MEENFYERGCKTARRVGDRWDEICEKETENLELQCKEETTNEKAHYHRLKYEHNEINAHLSAGAGERPQQVVAYNLKTGYYYLSCGVLLMAAEASLVVWTFDPLPGVGIKKFIIAAGITFLGSIIFERLLYFLSRLTTSRNFQILSLLLAVAAGIMAVVALVDPDIA